MTDDELFGEGAAIETAGDVGVQPPSQLDRDPEISTQAISAASSLRVPRSREFVGGWAFSYMVASVFVCLLLLGFWAHKLPSDRGSSIASNENSRGLTAPGESPHDRPAPVFVGRVTGIAGAKWSDEPNYIAPLGVRVALGRTYKLKSGLMEITYDSGAKVILEGPCSYEVDSTAGGYLTLGKLVARVGAGDEGRGTGEVVSGQLSVTSVKEEGGRRKEEGDRHNAASLATSHQPLATVSNPQSPIPNPFFTVRTPTAVVTDLGTEFGVEVAINGDTTSHVFEGTVVVQAGIRGFGDSGIGNSGIGESDKRPATAVAGGESDQSVTLSAGESVHVGRVRETHQEPAGALVRFTHPTAPLQFARRIVEPPKFIDLLDIVAGGDGRGNRRERGIDPSTGAEDPSFLVTQRRGDGRYHQVHWRPTIDGVFIPTGGANGVQLDSAGHVFDGFHQTTGTTAGSIWARAAEVSSTNQRRDRWDWVYSIESTEQFMPERRGLLCMHANAGITFDLLAMRRLHEGARPVRFHATTGLADANLVLPAKTPDGMADFWVFVDGRMAFQRKGVRPADGAVDVNVELGPNDGFLTLAVTDGNGFANFDWAVFGDPVLIMEITEPEKK